MNLLVRSERPADRLSVRHVNRTAFDTDQEADLVDALRDSGFAETSLVAVADGQLIGHILFSPVSIIDNTVVVPALSLAPMAVAPSHQRQGIGTKLVETGLESCRKLGHRIVVVLGDPHFYRRFGFSSEDARPLKSPFGETDAWMALELIPGSLNNVKGLVRYAPPFDIFL
ncbi:MAG: N-acetyltransferase [Fuerstiella sp.]